MENSTFLKSRSFKILLSFVITVGIISIAKSGYDFGQWFFDKTH